MVLERFNYLKKELANPFSVMRVVYKERAKSMSLVKKTIQLLESQPLYSEALTISQRLEPLTSNDWNHWFDHDNKMFIWELTGRDRELIVWRTIDKTIVFHHDHRGLYPVSISSFKDDADSLLQSVTWVLQ